MGEKFVNDLFHMGNTAHYDTELRPALKQAAPKLEVNIRLRE
jgi:hypothetical protein